MPAVISKLTYPVHDITPSRSLSYKNVQSYLPAAVAHPTFATFTLNDVRASRCQCQ